MVFFGGGGGERCCSPLPPLSLPTVMGSWSVRGGFCPLLPSPTTVSPLRFLTLFPPPLPAQAFSLPCCTHVFPELPPAWLGCRQLGWGARLCPAVGLLEPAGTGQNQYGAWPHRGCPCSSPQPAPGHLHPHASVTIIIIINLSFRSCQMKPLPHVFCALKGQGSPFSTDFLPAQVRSLVLCFSCRPVLLYL